MLLEDSTKEGITNLNDGLSDEVDNCDGLGTQSRKHKIHKANAKTLTLTNEALFIG